MAKKRHHYIPRAYLRFFCDRAGKVYVYLKDNPTKVIHQTPDNTAFHKYYYSQPLPGGGQDNDSLEDLFSKTESGWPLLVQRLQNRENTPALVSELFEYVCLQRVRVPAVRDAAEKMDAGLIKATMLNLEARGKLPPKPKGFEDILDHIQIAIDPHRSIHAMPTFMRAMGLVLDQMGFGIFRNVTKNPFLTSDNPVIYFDPSVPEDHMQPYNLQPGGQIVLCFPMTPELVLYGYAGMREAFSRRGLDYADFDDLDKIDLMNRLICRFAYKAVYARDPGCEALVKEFAHKSPILKTMIVPSEDGHMVVQQSIFGARDAKVKWQGP